MTGRKAALAAWHKELAVIGICRAFFWGYAVAAWSPPMASVEGP